MELLPVPLLMETSSFHVPIVYQIECLSKKLKRKLSRDPCYV